MLHKTDVLFNNEARKKLLKGIATMADAVSSTLGPRGQNVAIARATPKGEIFERIVLHDGVSVARAIMLDDEFEDLGAALLREASQKQVDAVGDGTTVVMILARAIIEECNRMISTGINPMALRAGLESGRDKLIKKIERLAIPLKTDAQMKQIATISAEDAELGRLVSQTLKKVGRDGVVDVVESKYPETEVEYQEGMQLNKGYYHPLMVTNLQRAEALYENPYILVTDKSIHSLIPLGKLLESMVAGGVSRPLVIISPDVSGEALALLIKNKLDGVLYTLVIKAPSYGDDQKNILHDIAILTGAKYITEDAGHKFEDVTPDDLGQAAYVTATKNETIISGGRGSKENLKKRIEQIRTQLREETQEFDQTRLKSRLGKLTDGIAVISVGGATEIEMKERRERVLDAVAALRSAMKYGIVPGGEIIYLSCLKELNEKILGEKILKNALPVPFKKLVSNAGLDAGEILHELRAQQLTKSIYTGFDVTDGTFKHMIEAGIVDPSHVSIEAIKNAVSVAVQIITSNVAIVPTHDMPAVPKS